MLSGKVEFPPVVIKIHWPMAYCPQCCCEEIICIATEMYMCVSCRYVSNGTTKYIEGKVVRCQT